MSNTVIISTKNGKVRGLKEKCKFPEVEFYSFYGIPYGQPPINELRFKDPVKVSGWKSIRDCTTPRQGCIQFSLKYFVEMGTEDCLYLNVHIPEMPKQNAPLKAVIVQIHPGGYLWGSPDPAHHGKPDFAMNCDVVYINIGFRLHVLGFLNLGFEECAGNQGLKDIILALKWVQDNASKFGGDPDSVTLVGSSSGAALINCLLLSPAAKGLFHKAVLMSGYLFNCVTLEQEQSVIKEALIFGQHLGFDGDNPRKLLSFLRTLPAKKLITEKKLFHRICEEDHAVAYPCGKFAPSVDSKSKNPVLPKNPRELIKTMNRVPIMVGNCQRESVIGFSKNRAHFTNRMYKTSFKQNCWGWAHGLSDQETDYVVEEIESFYLKDIPRDDVPLSIKCDILDDAAYSDLYETLIDVVSAELPESAFVYRFDYVGEINNIKIVCSPLLEGTFEGTFHGDDMSYWTKLRNPETPETKKMVDLFTRLISTFAKTGNPNHDGMSESWRPSTVENPCYLRISSTLQLVEGRLNNDRAMLWQNIKKNLNRDGI